MGNTRNRFWLVIVLSPACGLLAGTWFGGKKEGWNNSRLSAVLRGAPGSAFKLRNPYRGQDKAILAGNKLFRQHCSQCHGDDGEGTGEAPQLRTAVVRNTPDGVLFWFLKNGNLRAGMPSWSGLPPQQRWQLVSFLKSLQ
jgi:mono/diheme cytochrome c family protein